MTTNHSDQGFISNRGASDRLFPAHLLTSFIHHRMLGSNKPEDDFVTRVKTIPLKSWQTACQHRTSRGNLCPGCQYRRIGLRRSFCRPPTDHHLQSATAISVGLRGCKSLVQDSPKLTMRTCYFSGIKFIWTAPQNVCAELFVTFFSFHSCGIRSSLRDLCPDLPDGRLAAELPPGHPHPSAYGPLNSSGPFWSA